MKSIIAVAVLCAAIGAPAAEKNKPAPQALTIPKDAVPNPDGNTYSDTDEKGKKWTYIKTPFGVMKTPLADGSAGASPDSSATKAIDQGDTVRFEHPGPFGTMRWEKKKSDLTDEERNMLDTQNAKAEKND